MVVQATTSVERFMRSRSLMGLADMTALGMYFTAEYLQGLQ